VTTAPGSTAIRGAQDNVTLDHVTVAHESAGDGHDTAIELHAIFGRPSASLHAVALAGYTRGIVRTVDPGELFPLTVNDSVWDPSQDLLGGAGAGTFTESNNAHVAPALMDLAGGDLRPRGSSAQIDRDIHTPASGYADLNGSPAVDGNGDGSVWPDAGALEYLHRPPVIETTSVPPSTVAGTVTRFSATTSDPDGDHVNATWDFGDGDTASGQDTTHTFASTGISVVKLTATDEAGLTDRRTFQVAVSAGGQGRTAPPLPPPAPRRGHVRPLVTGVRLSSAQVRVRDARRLRLRFALNEAATVRLNARRAFGSRLIGVRGTVVLRGHAGRNSLSLLSSLRRLHLLRAGRLSLSITATDATGHSSAPHSVKLVLRR
jgi:PKD repeat protein